MKILIIEDEKVIRESIVTYLTDERYLCEIAVDYSSALEKIEMYEYDCILLDITLPGGNGLNLLKELKRVNRMRSPRPVQPAGSAPGSSVRSHSLLAPVAHGTKLLGYCVDGFFGSLNIIEVNTAPAAVVVGNERHLGFPTAQPSIERGLIAQVVPALPRPNCRVMDRVLGLRLVAEQDGGEAISSLESSLRQPLEGSLTLGLRLRGIPRSHSCHFTHLLDHATRCAGAAQSFNY